jgi:hypothetical protein
LAKRANNYEIRLLTASKEIGLRRLRSYTASLGCGAQIFHSFQDLQTALESAGEARARCIILHDCSIHLTSQKLSALARLARVFVIDQPQTGSAVMLPVETSPYWKQEAYFRCTLNTFLDSPVIRMAMAQLCQPETPFQIGNLLRWGTTEHTWQSFADISLSDAGLQFVRKLNLAGPCRRLTEMFTHFTHINLHSLGIDVEDVRFASDGIMTALIARCRMQESVPIGYLASELRVHEFYAGVVNKTSETGLEIGALFHQNPLQEDGQEKIVLTLDKDLTPIAVAKDEDLDKAG